MGIRIPTTFRGVESPQTSGNYNRYHLQSIIISTNFMGIRIPTTFRGVESPWASGDYNHYHL